MSVNIEQIAVTPLTKVDIPQVIALAARQQIRWHVLDARLAIPATAEPLTNYFEAQLSPTSGNQPLVAHDHSGAVRAFVVAKVSPSSIADNPERGGLAASLILPAPSDHDATEIAGALLQALDRYWRMQATSCDMLSWPTRDHWLFECLPPLGLTPDTTSATRGFDLMPATTRAAPAGLIARLARPHDVEQLVALNREAEEYHTLVNPFKTYQPRLDDDLRNRLARAFAPLAGDDPARFIVVEQDGEIVAMNDTFVTNFKPASPLTPFPASRYCYFRGTAVRADRRGQGIGHLLVQASFDAWQGEQFDFYYLHYNLGNPISRRFWPSLGFDPMLTWYQRKNKA